MAQGPLNIYLQYVLQKVEFSLKICITNILQIPPPPPRHLMVATLVIFLIIFLVHLKLGSLMQFPASIDVKYFD